MNESDPSCSAFDTAPSPKFLPVLFFLFFGSGCAALIYEIVWFQLLQLVIGSSAVSLAVLLGTFMGGMCLGSLGLARIVSATRHPLRVYAVLEFGIAVTGLLVCFAMPAVGRLYTTLLGHGMPGILLRAAVCIGCLLPPTVLMGATLPAVARWIETTPRGVSWLGFFYGGNTIGAVAGCLLAGFYWLRLYDGLTATLFAAGLNIAVATAALLLAKFAPYRPGQMSAARVKETPRARRPQTNSGPMLIAIALSGFCALAAEVVWTRNLSLLLGATVYTFSIILAVFLAGLGLGSSAGAAIGRNGREPVLWFAGCQLLQVVAIYWAAYSQAMTLPYWTLAGAQRIATGAKFQFDLMRCAWSILPSAILWGASFPLAIACTVLRGQDAAQLLGRTYAANTLGAIAGALFAGMLLVPWIGTQGVQILLIIVSVLGALVALQPSAKREVILSISGVALALLFSVQVPRIPWELVAYGRQIGNSDYGAHPVYFGEGMNASVAVTQTAEGRFFHVSGKTEASSLTKDMRLQRMLGHIPALLHPNAKSVLIVGCGAGVTAGTFVLHPSIERIVICDIEPLIPQVVATHFQQENHNVLRDPRVHIVYDDARHYVATSREKFDLITSDPIHPWVKGSAVLYSQEYFALCRERLKPGGLLTQWVPLYEADRAVVQSEMATFFSIFPYGTIWGNDDEGYGYDTVMLGQAAPLTIDIDALQRRFDRADHGGVQAALKGVGLGSAIELLSTYAGRFDDLRTWLAPAEINGDRNLRLQYLAGLQLESNRGAGAYEEILKFRKFPFDIFRGEPHGLADLQRSLLEPADR